MLMQVGDASQALLVFANVQLPGQARLLFPCSCKLATPPKLSSYLPTSSYQGKPVYYSHAHASWRRLPSSPRICQRPATRASPSTIPMLMQVGDASQALLVFANVQLPGQA